MDTNLALGWDGSMSGRMKDDELKRAAFLPLSLHLLLLRTQIYGIKKKRVLWTVYLSKTVRPTGRRRNERQWHTSSTAPAFSCLCVCVYDIIPHTESTLCRASLKYTQAVRKEKKSWIKTSAWGCKLKGHCEAAPSVQLPHLGFTSAPPVFWLQLITQMTEWEGGKKDT